MDGRLTADVGGGGAWRGSRQGAGQGSWAQLPGPQPPQSPRPPDPVGPFGSPYGPKGTTTLPSQAEIPIPWFPSAPPSVHKRSHATPIAGFLCPLEDGTTTRGAAPHPGSLAELLGERLRPRPLGAFRETGSLRDLRKLARGSLGGACWGCEARGRSRWEGWGDPLTKAMRGRMSPRPGPSCATVFGRGSPHPSGQPPTRGVPRRPSGQPPSLAAPRAPGRYLPSPAGEFT